MSIEKPKFRQTGGPDYKLRRGVGEGPSTRAGLTVIVTNRGTGSTAVEGEGEGETGGRCIAHTSRDTNVCR